MAETNTWARTLHDVGLATWMGGSLMGAVALNAAAKEATDPTDRIRVANAGWTRWTPINAIAIAAYAGGEAILAWANKGRLAHQKGVGRATVAKSVLSLITLAATAYSRALGQRLMDYGKVPVEDGTTAADETPTEVGKIQRQLKALQYAIPAHVGGLIAVNALMSEQQRTAQVAQGVARRIRTRT